VWVWLSSLLVVLVTLVPPSMEASSASLSETVWVWLRTLDVVLSTPFAGGALRSVGWSATVWV